MKDNTDFIAMCVSGFGGLLVWSNVYKLWKDKVVKGVNWFPSLYFMCGGCYSAFFLYHIHQHLAFYGTLITVCANAVWVTLAWIYTRPNK